MVNYLLVDKVTSHEHFKINELGSYTQGSLHLLSCPTPHLTEYKIKLQTTAATQQNFNICQIRLNHMV